MKSLLQKLLLSIISLTALVATATDVDFYIAAKGLNLRQTNASNPVVFTNESPFRFIAEVVSTSTNGVTNVVVRFPNKVSLTLTNIVADDSEPSDFAYEAGFTNKSALDKSFAAGVYNFIIRSVNDGSNNANLTIPKDAYPTAPRIANWQDAQEIESSLPFVLRWDAATNLTAGDLVFLDVFETNGNPVINTPDFLAGTNTALLIGANQLEHDKNYEAQLLFIKVGARNTNAVPDTTGIAGYFRQTKFTLSTLPEPSGISRVQLSSYNYSASENDGTANVTVTRTGEESDTVSVNLATSDGTAVDGTNYLGVNTTLTFAPSVTSTNVIIPILNDYSAAGNKSLNLWLSGLTGNAYYGSRSNASLTISDVQRAVAGKIQFAKTSNGVPESAGIVLLTVSRLSGTTGNVGVNFHTVDGSAQAGLDYIGTNGTLVIPSKKTSATLPIRILNDSLNESNETFFVVLDSTTGGASFGTNLITKIVITDNDPGGIVTLGSASYTTNENSGFFLVSVKRTPITGGTLAEGASVDFTTINGTALAGADYTATNGTLVFGSNELVKTVQVFVTNDALAEGDENLFFRLSNPQGGANLGAVTNATLTIKDDESSISISNATYFVSEAGTNVAITLVRSGALTDPVSVDYQTINGTAINGSDFNATNSTVTFPAGIGSKTVLIKIINDGVIENNEAFSVRLANPQGGVQLGTITNAVVTILNDDSAGSFHFSSTAYGGNEGSVANIVVNRLGGSAGGVSVYLSMVNGTASGSDYVNASQTLTFTNGEMSKIIPVTLNSDNLTESTETINLSLTTPTGGATIDIPSTAVLSINNASAVTCNAGTFNLTAPGMKATGFTAFNVSGTLVYGILDITGIEAGTTTKTITINLSDIPVGSTGSFPLNTSSDFAGYSVSTINTTTFCSTTKTYNSESPSTGCINIQTWDVANKVFKATFQFTAHGEDSGTVCGSTSTPGPVPTDTPSITSGQVWVNYIQSP